MLSVSKHEIFPFHFLLLQLSDKDFFTLQGRKLQNLCVMHGCQAGPGKPIILPSVTYQRKYNVFHCICVTNRFIEAFTK